MNTTASPNPRSEFTGCPPEGRCAIPEREPETVPTKSRRCLRQGMLSAALVVTILLRNANAGETYASVDEWESEPRTGEQPLNRLQFHNTHNSFQHKAHNEASIKDQLDKHNSWLIEFDVRWALPVSPFGVPTSTSGEPYVIHDCADPPGHGTLDDYLSQVASSNRVITGLTILQLDTGNMKVPGCFLPPLGVPEYLAMDKPDGWLAPVEGMVVSKLGMSKLYTKAEFENSDGKKWPTVQELLRRGKRIIPMITSGSGGLFILDPAV